MNYAMLGMLDVKKLIPMVKLTVLTGVLASVLIGCDCGNTGVSSRAYGPCRIGMNEKDLMDSGFTPKPFGMMSPSARYRLESELGIRYALNQPPIPFKSIEVFLTEGRVSSISTHETIENNIQNETRLIKNFGKPTKHLASKDGKIIVMIWGLTKDEDVKQSGLRLFSCNGWVTIATLNSTQMSIEVFASKPKDKWEQKSFDITF